jgi:hypothetical protein
MKRAQVIDLMCKMALDPDSEMYYRSRVGLLRRTGAAHREAFWNGFEGRPKKYVSGSWCAWAYAAGRKFRKTAPAWVPAGRTHPNH